MNLKQTTVRKNLRSLLRLARAIACVFALTAVLASANAAVITLWDTGAAATDATKPLTRADWKVVPSELVALEAEPIKAASDPGYWGREYSFKGDAIIENHLLLAVFSAASGNVSIYAKETPAQLTKESAPPPLTLGRKLAEILPLGASTSATPVANRFAVIRNASDEVILEINYSGKTGAAAAWISLGRTGIIELKPINGLKGLRLLSPLDYGILPTFLGDDLIYSPSAYPTANPISVPAENMFVGLQPGGDRILVLTWPKGRQQLQLGLAGADAQRRIESLDFQADGQSFYLTSLSAPGLWHREELKPIYLEKDVPLTWQRPFPAKWKTQLSESGVKTTYAFRQHKGTVWRGVPGSYEFPARFDGEAAILHFGKKVPPKGEALIYCLEPRDTPPTILTPVDILKATLGRAGSEAILDPAGRKLRTHHRRGGDGVHRACTCGCTEAIEAVFKAREECAKKEFISEAIDDMIFFVQRHVERIG